MRTLTLWALLGIIGIQLSLYVLEIRNATFDHDEFQHAHIAWNIFQGQRLYTDFFEHHGPAYSLLNAKLFQLMGLDAQTSTLFVFRSINFLYLLMLLVVTFLLGAHLLGSKHWSLAGVVLFSSTLIALDKSVEIRPDTLQVLFWLIALLCLMPRFGRWPLSSVFGSGVFMGLALQTNFKMIIGVAALWLFFALFYSFSSQKGISHFLKVVGVQLLGMVLVALLFLIYFWSEHSLRDYVYFHYIFNFVAVQDRAIRIYPEILGGLLSHQITFVLSLGCGFILLLSGIEKGQATTDSWKKVFLIVVTAIPFIGIFLNLYSQYYLVFLPLCAIIAVFPYQKLTAACLHNAAPAQKVASTAVLGILVWAPLFFQMTKAASFSTEPGLAGQLKEVEKVLKTTQRHEPVALLAKRCGGYVFNRDLRYYWYPSVNLTGTINQLAGENIYGRSLVELLEQESVRWVVYRDPPSRKGRRRSIPPESDEYPRARKRRLFTIPHESLEYLHENYRPKGCLWERR